MTNSHAPRGVYLLNAEKLTTSLVIYIQRPCNILLAATSRMNDPILRAARSLHHLAFGARIWDTWTPKFGREEKMPTSPSLSAVKMKALPGPHVELPGDQVGVWTSDMSPALNCVLVRTGQPFGDQLFSPLQGRGGGNL